MSKNLIITGLILFYNSFHGSAQTTFPIQGIPDERTGWYAFKNATIQLDPFQKLENGVLIIREGKIEAIGQQLTIPAGAVLVDLQGRYIYPSFIDLASNYGLQKETEAGQASSPSDRRGRGDVWVSNRPGPYGWNEALRSDYRAVDHVQPNEKDAEALLKAGFGAVLTHRMDGISRGSGALMTLGNQTPGKELVKKEVAHILSFKKGSATTNYPGSLMGCIALLRQTYLDGQWYINQNKEVDLSLEAWNRLQDLPQIFDVRDWQEVLRAQAIANEFDKTYIYLGPSDAYKRVEEIKQTGATMILPLEFPEPFKMEGPFDAHYVGLKDMKHWEWAPANAALLEKAGVPIVLTAHGLKKTDQFLAAVRKAIQHGLSEAKALEALTLLPARLLRVEDEMGSLAVGKRAQFLICSGPIFNAETVIYENWVQGQPHILQPADEPDLDGKYRLKAGQQSWNLEVRGGPKKNEMTLKLQDTVSISVKSTWDRGRIHLQFKLPTDSTGQWMLSGQQEGRRWYGRGTDPQGMWLDWEVTYQDTVKVGEEKERPPKTVDLKSLGPITYPFLPFGWTVAPAQEVFLIRNATLWTNEKEGILTETDILLRNGKIDRIGKRLDVPSGAIIIDATGKHVTSGIIDEHSHIAISRGVNECTQENTAEVRISDVVNSEDINIYRQLSGGVTTAQLLHGSCNPIGGQSAIIKLRWGSIPEEMKFEAASGYIKFALGENVKRGNSASNSRYPNTRMGVEQVYVNAFTKAREYEQKKADPQERIGLRRDLELETLSEIMAGKRFISCHSYVQSEITMLMRVAEQFDFKVNTFTHILEGYKVADKMKQHGAGGSSFSDWWAYKFEVYDAIPYNGAIMHEQGVVTAFNSDDPEMARRLNQEAAKAVLYGGVSEEEALKFVTLNPAKLLRIDHRVGSLKVGKDADVVIWSDHPLSVYAMAETTFIDGKRYFDRQVDLERREEVRLERQRLIAKMKEDGGGKGRRAQPKSEHHYHCDTVTEEIID